MKFRILSSDDVRKALPMGDAIEAMRDAFAALSQGRVNMPLRTTLEMPVSESVTLFMPASTEDGALGAKIVSVVPQNAALNLPLIHGLVLLIDSNTGRPLAALDGNSMTAIRTGATSGLATSLLARADASRVAVIGSGVQARTQLEAVCSVRDVSSVAVYSRNRASAEVFASDMEGTAEVPHNIEIADTARAAVATADIVCTATSSAAPVLLHGEVADGAHINAVGSFTPDMKELDPELVASCRVVVDQREAVLAEAGEIIAAIRAGLISPTDLAELGGLVTQGSGARTRDSDVTLFKSVGLAVQDLCAARVALMRAERDGLGTVVDM